MLTKLKNWYEFDSGAERFTLDKKWLANSYPNLYYRTDALTGTRCLQGRMTLVAECGIPNHIPIRIEFPLDYPYHEPHAYEITDQFPHIANRHFFPDGQCCLWLPPESRWDKNNPDALCYFLDQLAIFFDRQLVCEA